MPARIWALSEKHSFASERLRKKWTHGITCQQISPKVINSDLASRLKKQKLRDKSHQGWREGGTCSLGALDNCVNQLPTVTPRAHSCQPSMKNGTTYQVIIIGRYIPDDINIKKYDILMFCFIVCLFLRVIAATVFFFSNVPFRSEHIVQHVGC